MARKVLVTGGAGFVGSHLVDALVEAGHEVRVLDNLSPQVHGETLPDYLSSDAELMRGDMQDCASVRAAMEGIEVVFHLAAAVGVGNAPARRCLTWIQPARSVHLVLPGGTIPERVHSSERPTGPGAPARRGTRAGETSG